MFSTDISRRNWVSLFFLLSQVLGDRGHSPALPAGPDLGLWSDVHQREHRHHGLPVHHLQLAAGHVHLHLSLHTAEEGEELETERRGQIRNKQTNVNVLVLISTATKNICRAVVTGLIGHSTTLLDLYFFSLSQCPNKLSRWPFKCSIFFASVVESDAWCSLMICLNTFEGDVLCFDVHVVIDTLL